VRPVTDTVPVIIVTTRPARARTRMPSAAMTMRRRSSRSRKHACVEPEDHRRCPSHQRGKRNEERIVGQRGDEQWAGRDRDAVAEVGRPRGRQQPAEPGAQTRRDELRDELAHKVRTLCGSPDRVQRGFPMSRADWIAGLVGIRSVPPKERMTR
jgi:hypothetical protein